MMSSFKIFVKRWGLNRIWHGQIDLSWSFQLNCDPRWKLFERGDVFSSWECTQCVSEDRRSRGASWIPWSFVKTWKHVTVMFPACQKKKKSHRISLAQARIRLLTWSVEKMKAETLNPSSTKVLNVWKEGYTEMLSWREEERSRNRIVSCGTSLIPVLFLFCLPL